MVKWGIIGCGDVCEVKSGPAFYKCEGSALTAVMRRNASLAADFASRHHVPLWFDNVEALIQCPEVNAIYIATPPSSHKEYTIAALKAGKPVYVEKPMAMNADECREMKSASEKLHIPLFVAYYRRALEEFIFIKDLITNNSIGEVRMVNLHLYTPPRTNDLNNKSLPWRVMPEFGGAGYFFDMASHQIDLLVYFLGKAINVKAIALNQAKLYPAEDTLSASILFECGVLATTSWFFTAYELFKRDHVEIIGTKGSIQFSIFDNAPIELKNNMGSKIFNFTRPVNIQQPMIQSVVDCLNGNGKSFSNSDEALHVNEIMSQVVHDYYL